MYIFIFKYALCFPLEINKINNIFTNSQMALVYIGAILCVDHHSILSGRRKDLK